MRLGFFSSSLVWLNLFIESQLHCGKALVRQKQYYSIDKVDSTKKSLLVLLVVPKISIESL